MVNGFKALLRETCDVEKGEEAGRIYKLSSKKALEKDHFCMYITQDDLFIYLFIY